MFHPKKLMFGFRKKKKKNIKQTHKTLSWKRNKSHFPIFRRFWNVRDFRICCPSLHRSGGVFPGVSGSRGATDMSCNLKPMIIKSNLGSASNHRLPRWFVGPQTGLVFAELPGRKILDDTEEGGKNCGNCRYGHELLLGIKWAPPAHFV